MEREPEVTISVYECSEFHSLGEAHEGNTSVKEAVRIWNQIPPERRNGIKSMSVCIGDKDDHDFGTEYEFISGKRIDFEMLPYYPDVMENKKAQDMMKSLMKEFPHFEKMGDIPQQLQESGIEQVNQEKRTGKHR